MSSLMGRHCPGLAADGGRRGEIAIGRLSMASRLETATSAVWLVRTFALAFCARKHEPPPDKKKYVEADKKKENQRADFLGGCGMMSVSMFLLGGAVRIFFMLVL